MAKKLTKEQWEARMRLKGMSQDDIETMYEFNTANPAIAGTLKGVRTIEQTAKKWKGLKLIGVMGLLVGIAMVAAGGTTNGEPDGLALTGTLLVLGGPCLYIFARIMSWWHHG